mgnify:CR=1
MQSDQTITPPTEGILCETPLLESDMRNVLEQVLHLKCIVPSFVSGHSGNTARCLLEEIQDARLFFYP